MKVNTHDLKHIQLGLTLCESSSIHSVDTRFDAFWDNSISIEAYHEFKPNMVYFINAFKQLTLHIIDKCMACIYTLCYR